MIVANEQLAFWLSRLVRIPSVTPEQAGPRAGDPLHLKQRCLAKEGYNPPDNLSMRPQQPDESNVQTSDDAGRPTNHLAIARFFARLNDPLTRFWKISKRWLHTLADCLSRPYTSDVVRLLNQYAV
jgi:hypothetical protein